MARGSGFQVRPIFGHTLFLFTFILFLGGWITAFVGQILYELAYHKAFNSGSAVGVAWFGIFLELFLSSFIFHTLATDSIEIQRFAVAIWTAIATVFAILGTNIGIFGTGSQRAVGVGWLLLSIVNLLWLLYFTAHEDTVLFHFFNSFSSGGFATTARAGRTSHRRSRLGLGSSPPANSGGISNISFPTSTTNNLHGQSGLGASNGPYSGMTKSANGGADPAGSMTSLGGGPATMGAINGYGNAGRMEDGMAGGNESVAAETPRPERQRARALYAYTASPDDPNEISFTKGEVLTIVDSSGRWWQVERPDGSTGIVPSNFFALLPAA